MRRKALERSIEQRQRIGSRPVVEQQCGLGEHDVDRHSGLVRLLRIEHREGLGTLALFHQHSCSATACDQARAGLHEALIHLERSLPVAVPFCERTKIEECLRRIVTGAQPLAESPRGLLDVSFAKREQRKSPLGLRTCIIILQQPLELDARFFDAIELHERFRQREHLPLGVDAACSIGRGDCPGRIVTSSKHLREQLLRRRRLRIAGDGRFGERAGIAKNVAFERKISKKNERGRIERLCVEGRAQRPVSAEVIASGRCRLCEPRERLAWLVAREAHGVPECGSGGGVAPEAQRNEPLHPRRIGAPRRALAPQWRELLCSRKLLAVECHFERPLDGGLRRLRRCRGARVLVGGGTAVAALEGEFRDDRVGTRLDGRRLSGVGGAGRKQRDGREDHPTHERHYSGRRPDPGEFRSPMKDSIRQRLDRSLDRSEEVGRLLADPGTAGHTREFRELSMEYARLEPLAARYRQFLALERELAATHELAADADAELRALGADEARRLEAALAADELALRELLVPKDPHDERNIFLEIRAGTGGDEAAIFAGDLLRMYTRYAERRGWTVELISQNPGEHGGYREVVCRVLGKSAYSWLRFEAGTHRVQRVPATEAQGRIHTSACTVAVLPELDEVDEITVNPAELRIDTFRSSGAGGQHVNKTDSAIRITHLPSGIVVECQDERSQHKNRARAMALLSARLLAAETDKRSAAEAATRKSQVGSGDRSERIRTYNFPQGRVTDHRVNVTLYRLDAVMDGDLDDLIEPLRLEHQAELLAREG